MTGPDGQKACGITAAYPGDVVEDERLMAPLKQFGPLVVDVISRMPYRAQQSLIDAATPPHVLPYWKAEFRRRCRRFCSSQFEAAASRVSPGATAFPHRTGYHLGIYSLWADRAQSEPNIAWARRAWNSIRTLAAGGVYVNELGDDEGVDRVRMAYGLNYERLQQIKAKYDPENVFRLTANIMPVAV